MANSIAEGIKDKPESLEAEFSLVIQSESQSKRLVIFVEGKSDEQVYSRLFGECCHTYSSNRWPGMLRLERVTISLNKKYSTRFITIKDADFDHLEGKTYDIPNFFLTDTHDLETMMITRTFLRQLTSNYSITAPCRFVCQALTDIIHLSYLKWMNAKDDRNIPFGRRSCKVGTLYDGCTAVPINDWLATIASRLPKCKEGGCVANLPTPEEVNTFEQTHPIKGQILQLTNGHDLIDALVERLKSSTKRNVATKEFEDMLRKSYTMKDFSSTNLYQAISHWEQLTKERPQSVPQVTVQP